MRYLLILIIPILISCSQNKSEGEYNELSDEFQEYWYAGKAELASYKLKQARYGQIHDGHAVLIFVTEDFSKSKQVKLDRPQEAGDDSEKVMKLNFTKNFNTGIYPYSIMMSVFSPVYTITSPLKLTMSSQEWCGHVFTQMNKRGGNYEIRQYSYFESEGDRNYSVSSGFTEDEIWNRIRLNYKSLPQGDISIIPGLIMTRLLHKELEPVSAKAELITSTDTLTYRVIYENGRELSIDFSAKQPHHIMGWQEKVKGIDGKELKTTAELMDTLVTDYWSKNKKEYLYLRDSLNLNN